MSNKKDPKVKRDAYRYRSMGQVAKSIDCFVAYLRISPQDYIAALDLGELYMRVEQFGEACKVYAKILEYKPKDAVAASNLGGALLRAGRAEDAKSLLLYALELDPKNVHARINLGGVYQALGDRKANLDNALEAVALMPSSALAFNNLGSALSDLALFKEAKHAYETAVMLEPNQVDALINLAGTESKLGEPARAAEMYERVITLLPAQEKMRADAVKFYAAFEYLKQGQLEKGWEYYDGGFSLLVPLAGARSPRRSFDVPRWEGKPLQGKTLMVWREQGLGDELLFYTCLHELKDMGGRVIVECDKRLVEVLERSFPEFTVRPEAFLPQDDGKAIHSDFDFHVPVGSLMRYFRPTLESFQRSGAYIKTDPAKVAKFEARLAPYKEDYRLVGICWRSGKLDPVRNLGYTTLDEWGEVLQTPGFKFVNLQYGECEAELQQAEEKYGAEILRWPDLNLRNDLDDIFALMHCLDAVTSVQTAVLVMAGSAGTPSVGVKAGGWTRFGGKRSSYWHPTSTFADKFTCLVPALRLVARMEALRGFIKLLNINLKRYFTPDDIISNKEVFQFVLGACVQELLIKKQERRVDYEAYIDLFLYLIESKFDWGYDQVKEVIGVMRTQPNVSSIAFDKDRLGVFAKQLAKEGKWDEFASIEPDLRRIPLDKYRELSSSLAWSAYVDGRFAEAMTFAEVALDGIEMERVIESRMPVVLIGCGARDAGLALLDTLSKSSNITADLICDASRAFLFEGDVQAAFDLMCRHHKNDFGDIGFVQQMVALASYALGQDALVDLIRVLYRDRPRNQCQDLYSIVALRTWNKWGLDEATHFANKDLKEGRHGINYLRFSTFNVAMKKDYDPECDYVSELVRSFSGLDWLIYSDLGKLNILRGYTDIGFKNLKKAKSIWSEGVKSTWPDRYLLNLEFGEVEAAKEGMLDEYRKIPHHHNALSLLYLLNRILGREGHNNLLDEDVRRKRFFAGGFEQLMAVSGLELHP